MDGAQAATRGGARRRRPLRPRSRRFSSRSRRLPNRTPSRRREAWRRARGHCPAKSSRRRSRPVGHRRGRLQAGASSPCRMPATPAPPCRRASPAWRTACPPSKAARCRGLWAPSTWRRAVVTAWRRRRACSRPPASAWSCSSVPTEPPRASTSARPCTWVRRPRPTTEVGGRGRDRAGAQWAPPARATRGAVPWLGELAHRHADLGQGGRRRPQRRPRPAAHGPGWGQRGRQTQRRQQLSVDVVPGLTVETSRALSWSGREDDDRIGVKWMLRY